MLLLLLFLGMIKICACYNGMPFIQNPEINFVSVSNRINYVLIAVTKNIHQDDFDLLISSYINLEKKAFQKAKEMEVEWITYVSIGGESLIKIEAENDVDALLNVTNMYEKAVVNMLNNFTTVFGTVEKNADSIARKEYTLIISDYCDDYFIREVSEFTYRKNYIFETGLLTIDETRDDEEEGYLHYCAEGLDPDYIEYGYPIYAIIEESREIFYSDFLPIYVHVFTPDYNLTDFYQYTNMEIDYYSTPESAKINLFVLTNDIYSIPYQFITSEIFSNCIGSKNGSFFGYYRNLNNKKNKKQLVTISLPLHFNDNNSTEYFLYNYKNLMNRTQAESFIPKDCKNFQTAFSELNSLPGNVEQQNILILEDPYPGCMDFDLEWKNKNRHLHIIVLYSEALKSNYSNFSGKVKISYIDLDNANALNFSDIPAICKSKEDESIVTTDELAMIRTFPSTTTTTTTTTTVASATTTTTAEEIPISEEKEFNFFSWYMILGKVIFLIAAIAITVKIIFMIMASKRFKRIQKQFKNQKGFDISTTKKYWKTFIEDTNFVIDYNCVLGKGSNAIVYKALMLNRNPFNFLYKNLKISNIANRNVAVKIPNKFKDIEIKKFIQQIEALTLFKSHSSILTIIGWTLQGEIPVLVTELAQTNLLNFVQTSSKFQNFEKFVLQILWQISNALAFVASHKYIHRDVACRNILWMEGNLVKLADFDLCCIYDAKNGVFKETCENKFPIKWLSLEALIDGIFSEKSDVWAFGILCFEIYSFGLIPYGSMSPEGMMDFLEADKRLDKPEGTPDYIYDLMIACWSREPNNRPNFMQINKKITSKLEIDSFKYGYLALKKLFVEL